MSPPPPYIEIPTLRWFFIAVLAVNIVSLVYYVLAVHIVSLVYYVLAVNIVSLVY
jgi:hypothetical protein